jgi:hypothetical protein
MIFIARSLSPIHVSITASSIGPCMPIAMYELELFECEGEKCYATLCLSVWVWLFIWASGLRVWCFRGDISQTFQDAVVRHIVLHDDDVRLRYIYTPMVNQLQNNSTLAVGLTIKILPPQCVLDWRVPKNYFPHGWRHPKNKMARSSQLNSAN